MENLWTKWTLCASRDGKASYSEDAGEGAGGDTGTAREGAMDAWDAKGDAGGKWGDAGGDAVAVDADALGGAGGNTGDAREGAMDAWDAKGGVGGKWGDAGDGVAKESMTFPPAKVNA